MYQNLQKKYKTGNYHNLISNENLILSDNRNCLNMTKIRDKSVEIHKNCVKNKNYTVSHLLIE